jgi:iron-sulfur cluster repair protein YtfE (RIC family)
MAPPEKPSITLPPGLALDTRSGLPEDLLFLLETYPRQRWPEITLHETAERWLQIHDWFRQFSSSLLTGTTDFRKGRQSAPEFHRWLEPRLETFLEFLEGHHHHEDSVYFPAFTRAEPKLELAFAILDRDHDSIHARLAALEASGKEMREARLSSDPDKVRFAADRLAGTLEGLLGPLRRHLHDEEDIVIPLILDRGDPVSGR